jgi:hypothetical protein
MKMKHDIPDELLTLYDELCTEFHAKHDELLGVDNELDKKRILKRANDIDVCMRNLAMGQMDRALKDFKSVQYEQEQKDTARTLGEGE